MFAPESQGTIFVEGLMNESKQQQLARRGAGLPPITRLDHSYGPSRSDPACVARQRLEQQTRELALREPQQEQPLETNDADAFAAG